MVYLAFTTYPAFCVWHINLDLHADPRLGNQNRIAFIGA